MPTQPTAQPAENIVELVQFKVKEPPVSDVVTALKDETIDEWDDRRKRNRASTAPEHHFLHTGAVPKLLLQMLRDKKLKLVDAHHQRRISGSEEISPIRRHRLVTFTFAATSSNPKQRQKDLDAGGMRVLDAYLGQRWEQVVVASFPDAPGLQSVLFVGKAQEPTNARDIKDATAKDFGVIITRRGSLQPQTA